jgi:glycine/D-amino acid oxidase-like deaminating enzyme
MDKKEKSGTAVTSEKNSSYWRDTTEPLKFDALDKDLETDIVIIGGGIAGVTIAYCLMQSGKKVVLLEREGIAGGESGRTSGHLVSALNERYYKLEQLYDQDIIKAVANSEKAAIDFIERAVSYEKIECDFERVDGYLFLHPADKPDSLKKELKACQNAGIEVVELPVMPGFRDPLKCLKYYGQAQFHPVKYINGLCKAITERGGQIYTDTSAYKITSEGVTTKDGIKVKAEHVVLASNKLINDKYGAYLKQEAYKTYLIGARIERDSLKKALWWDTGDFSVNSEIPPNHYVRIQKFDDKYDLLLCGGEDHQVKNDKNQKISQDDRFGLLEYWARQHFEIKDVIYQWSGEIMEPMDSLAFIGKNPNDEDNLYIVSGDSGNGLTHATIAGILITDLINGKENEWEKAYDPSRLKVMNDGKAFF